MTNAAGAAGAAVGAGQSASVVAAKTALRARVRAARRANATPVDERAHRIAEGFFALPAVTARLRAGATVLAYVSLATEPPTAALRAGLLERELNVLLPVAGAAGQLRWVADPGASALAWGVPGQPGLPASLRPIDRPTTPEIIVIPALAVTADGRRLGQGGGYYDRLLGSLPPASRGGPLRVAVVGPGEVLDSIPTDPHDAGVDATVVG